MTKLRERSDIARGIERKKGRRRCEERDIKGGGACVLEKEKKKPLRVDRFRDKTILVLPNMLSVGKTRKKENFHFEVNCCFFF